MVNKKKTLRFHCVFMHTVLYHIKYDAMLIWIDLDSWHAFMTRIRGQNSAREVFISTKVIKALGGNCKINDTKLHCLDVKVAINAWKLHKIPQLISFWTHYDKPSCNPLKQPTLHNHAVSRQPKHTKHHVLILNSADLILSSCTGAVWWQWRETLNAHAHSYK